MDNIENTIEVFEALPTRMSMRKSALTRANCGGDLTSLYDSPRFDSRKIAKPRRSWKTYRHSQYKE